MLPAIEALGIDVGSTTVKIVGLDGQGKLAWHMLEEAEPRTEAQIERLLAQARREMVAGGGRAATRESRRHLEEVVKTSPEGGEGAARMPIVATGYGRRLVNRATGGEQATTVTEISCHARGVYRALGHGGTLVDIGGQDSKVIAISPVGKVMDFAMNDKCAAGTGRFLENTSGRLRVALDCMGSEALSASEEIPISSTCTVFAESEVISLLAHGISVGTILRGLHRSLVRRIVSMIYTVGLVSPLMLSGGVVQNPAIQRMLAEETGERVLLPDHPQLMGAYGAALFASET